MTKLNNSIRFYNPDITIIEKKLGISGDYQFNAIRSKNFFQSNWHKNKLQVLEKLIKFNKKMLVLDLGTGSGNFEIRNHKRVREIFGVDYNNLALEFLQRYLKQNRIKNVTLIQADIKTINKLDLPKCDCIVLIDVIEHLKMTDVKKLVGELKPFLKSDGIVGVVTPNYNSPWSVMEYLFDHALTFLLPRFGECQHLSRFNPANLKAVFEINGFRTRQLKTFNLFSWLLPPSASGRGLDIELLSNMKFGNLLIGVFKKI